MPVPVGAERHTVHRARCGRSAGRRWVGRCRRPTAAPCCRRCRRRCRCPSGLNATPCTAPVWPVMILRVADSLTSASNSGPSVAGLSVRSPCGGAGPPGSALTSPPGVGFRPGSASASAAQAQCHGLAVAVSGWCCAVVGLPECRSPRRRPRPGRPRRRWRCRPARGAGPGSAGAASAAWASAVCSAFLRRRWASLFGVAEFGLALLFLGGQALVFGVPGGGR